MSKKKVISVKEHAIRVLTFEDGDMLVNVPSPFDDVTDDVILSYSKKKDVAGVISQRVYHMFNKHEVEEMYGIEVPFNGKLTSVGTLTLKAENAVKDLLTDLEEKMNEAADEGKKRTVLPVPDEHVEVVIDWLERTGIEVLQYGQRISGGKFEEGMTNIKVKWNV